MHEPPDPPCWEDQADHEIAKRMQSKTKQECTVEAIGELISASIDQAFMSYQIAMPSHDPGEAAAFARRYLMACLKEP